MATISSEYLLLALKNARTLLMEAQHELIRARTSIEFVEQQVGQPFTRAQAAAELRAKADTYGPAIAWALRTQACEWEAADAILKHGLERGQTDSRTGQAAITPAHGLGAVEP